VAAGLAGPARPFSGAVRDFVLGLTVLDGQGRVLRFGGTVFKNVAGFDAFRLMAGALGRLGVILEVSLRVSPLPASTRWLALEMSRSAAAARLVEILGRPTPISGACHDGERLRLRLAGPPAGVEATARALGGEVDDSAFWEAVRDIRHGPMAAERLWRLSVPMNARIEDLEGERLDDWAGAQIWLAGDAAAETVREAAARAGGHATLFRGALPGEAVFTPLAPGLLALHRRLAAVFDPDGVLNPGRMYEDL
jgi:glycolate oxidase FAD binding subunit